MRKSSHDTEFVDDTFIDYCSKSEVVKLGQTMFSNYARHVLGYQSTYVCSEILGNFSEFARCDKWHLVAVAIVCRPSKEATGDKTKAASHELSEGAELQMLG